MQESLELSSDGFKFPYRRFLTDVGTGLFVQILFLYTVSNPIEAMKELSTLDQTLQVSVVIGSLLVSPICGVVFSSLAYLLLSPLLVLIDGLLFIVGSNRMTGWLLLSAMQRHHALSYRCEQLSITWKDYWRYTALYGALVEVLDHRLSDRIHHLEGIVILLRNMSGLALWAAVIGTDSFFPTAITAFALLLLAASYVVFASQVIILARSAVALEMDDAGLAPSEYLSAEKAYSKVRGSWKRSD